MKKRLLTVILSAVLILCTAMTASCGEKAPTYNNNVDPAALTAAVNSALPIGDTLAAPVPDLILGYFEGTENFESFAILQNSAGANIDEYGIIKAASDETVADVEASVNNYIKSRLDMWMPEYMPEEKPKLENATVKVFGRFVVYSFLSEENTAILMNTVEESLTVK